MTKESLDHLRHWLIYIRSDSNPIGVYFFFSKGPCKWEWDDKVAPIKWWIFSKNNIFAKNDIHTESNLVKVLTHNKLFFFLLLLLKILFCPAKLNHIPPKSTAIATTTTIIHKARGTPKSTWVLWLVLILNRGLWV